MLICWKFSCSFAKGKKTVLSLLTFYKIVKELVFFPPDSVPLPVSHHGMSSRALIPHTFVLLLFVCMCQTLELFANRGSFI